MTKADNSMKYEWVKECLIGLQWQKSGCYVPHISNDEL